MIIQRVAAFTDGSRGGNPAGVVICEALPEAAAMQAIAAEIGYSETAFAAPLGDTWQVRYFAPEAEVDFCGHATIALGAALARQQGSGRFALRLNHADITVEGVHSATEWSAAFSSPPTRTRALSAAAVEEILALFGLTRDDLDPRIAPTLAHAGMDHPVIALRERNRLAGIAYDFGRGQELAQRERFCTFALIHVETPQLIHARNPFPFGGVYEDPATGAAAAALAGYLRELGWPAQGPILIRQGEDMGVPCCLQVDLDGPPGAPVKVSGSARSIEAV